MELFKNTNFDFLGYKWPFILASLVLSVAGVGSLLVKGGPHWGIEFKGGMQITAKFATEPPIEKVRSVLSSALSSTPSVQTFEAGSNELLIGTEGADDAVMAKNQQTIVEALSKAFGSPGNGKLDINNTSTSQLANRIGEPLQRAGVNLSQQQLQELAASITGWRDQRGGLITKIDDLKAVPGLTAQVITVLNTECYPAPYTVARNFESVGPKAGADLRQQAIQATLLALAGMLVYIWFRFEWIYGVGAVIAVFHDTIITIGLFSIFDKEITLTVIAALLTLVGYSMNDTIVIFDRIRENLQLGRGSAKGPGLAEVINQSVNQTLSRTIMTSGLTFLAVLALLIWGGPVLHGFSLALVIGIIIGTYSSVFVASPIVLFWHDWAGARKAASAPVAPAASARPTPNKVKSAR